MARTVLLTYATERFRAQQWLSARTARRVGGFDEVRRLGPDDVDPGFRARNAEVLAAERGAGYWLWKPHVVLRTLEGLEPGDVLFYCDAGSRFRSSPAPLVDLCRANDVVSFELARREAEWTKRDAFVLLGADEPRFSETRQRLASFLLLRRCPTALDLAGRWLAAAEDPRVLTDRPNECGLPNHPGFRDHRHDQSIWSLLVKRAGLPGFRDPSTKGDPAGGEPVSPYGRILSHRRTKPIAWRWRAMAALGLPP